MSTDPQPIKITGEPTLDPNVCKFIVDHQILPDATFTCRSKEMAEGSPLLEAMFSIGGLIQVMVSGDTLTIAKSNDTPWPEMGREIGGIIREQIASGKQLIAENAATKGPSEQAMRTSIEELFASEINPQIASHGGQVELADIEGTKVYLRLGGGCQGCASANATLKLGIEKLIRERVPDVTEIIDVTDHSAGDNPYY